MAYRRLLLFGVIFVVLVLSMGCIQPPPGEVNNTTNTTIPPASGNTFQHKGVSLSPKSFSQTDFTDFFSKTKQAGDIVSWAGDWDELGNTNGAPAVVAGLSPTYSYIPLVEAQFFTQSDGKLLRTMDIGTKQRYKDEAVSFAGKYKPKYLAIGIEVNILYEKSPQDFEDFASFYSDVYDAVKAASPGTKVFTIFQLEKMKGMGGGLFGGSNDPSKAEWSLIDRFPKSDIAAFTTYPSLVFKDPSDIPIDYYSEIRSHTDKPIAFTEIGWHSAASPAGWEGSDSKQADFVGIFFNQTKSLDGEIAVWSFLYDQNAPEPFNSMGLYRGDGTAKPVWNAWINAK